MIMQNDYNQADIEFLRGLMGLSQDEIESLKTEIKQGISNGLKQEVLNEIDTDRIKQEILSELDIDGIKENIKNSLEIPGLVRYGVYGGTLKTIPKNVTQMYAGGTSGSIFSETTETELNSLQITLSVKERASIPLINMKRKIVLEGKIVAYFIPIRVNSRISGGNIEATYSDGSIHLMNIHPTSEATVALSQIVLHGLILDFRNTSSTLDNTTWTMRPSVGETWE